MFNDENILHDQLADILQRSRYEISSLRPSEWVENNVVMGNPFPGPYRYSRTPYWREVIDCLSPDHPARWITVLKGQQSGYSAGVIIPALAWIIANNPADVWFTVGAPNLVKKSGLKLDKVLNKIRWVGGSRATGTLKDAFKSAANRVKNNKTGDTDALKEFDGGSIMFGTLDNHRNIADFTVQYGFFDDYDRAPEDSNDSGSTDDLLQGRFSTYEGRFKIFKGSTPLLRTNSHIEKNYLKSDQRKFYIPCPACHEHIELRWEFEDGNGGMTYESKDGSVIASTVGYVCQKCAGFFQENNKLQQLNDGIWVPGATPKSDGHVGFHINNLYTPPGMVTWAAYAQQHLEAHPPGQPAVQSKKQVFDNTVLALSYEPEAREMKATKIMENTQPYQIGEVPESLSISHGNGNIILITCGSDLNGTMRGVNGAEVCDARLDYEILAHSETGATYSITHGSIGTFIPRENTLKGVKVDRKKWTYEHNKENSVWTEFEKLLRQTFKTDTGREMKIALTGLDCGAYATNGAYPFLDKTNNPVVGVKGDPNDRYLLADANLAVFKLGQERAKLHILQVGIIKDRIAEYMQLNWQRGKEEQPPNFMNFPMSDGILYQKENYFLHYEAESRVERLNTNGATEYRWQKKGSSVQNHLFDCRVYNLAIREIYLYYFIKMASPAMKEKFKNKQFTWADLGEYYRANTTNKGV